MFILLATLRKQSPGPRPERQRAAPSAGVSSPLLHPRFPGATSSFCTTHPRATDSPGTSSQTSGKLAVKPTGGVEIAVANAPPRRENPPQVKEASRQLGGRREAWEVGTKGLSSRCP